MNTECNNPTADTHESWRDNQVARFSELDVEGFTLSDGKGATRHFEWDQDLEVKTIKALGMSGDQRAVLLVSLGIDDHDCHRVQLNFRAGQYDDGAHDAITEAIDALEVIRQQLGMMQATPGARSAERNAFQIGRDSVRLGST